MKLILGHFRFCYYFNTTCGGIGDMPSCSSSPVRHSRHNSPFSHDEAGWVILKFGEIKNLSDVRRAFRLEFFPKNPRGVPQLKAFERLVMRFETSRATRPLTSRRRTAGTAEEVERVKEFFEDQPNAHVRKASVDLEMSFLRLDSRFGNGRFSARN